MNQTKKEVQAILGLPAFAPPNTNISWYPESGLSIQFDDFDQVSEIHFSGPTPKDINIVGHEWRPTKHQIYDDLNVFMPRTEVEKKLGIPFKSEPPILSSADTTYFWKTEHYIFKIEFWKDTDIVRTLSVKKTI